MAIKRAAKFKAYVNALLKYKVKIKGGLVPINIEVYKGSIIIKQP